ncbi:hypothetical protein BDV95DRAFT_82229 [Massariosphaeria phaeospora]|uniref:DNA-directed RNA polymerase subunit n=1 Tax=Massariosphaeria phaeospora TaxID=100035 RepID=A0A7C8IB06_9PLEO|nr:hypothetical protein BDV95DRAFT_82229 [Massariosphaeria phaeospora]
MAPIHNDHPPPESLFHLATITQYVPLPPASLNAPHPAICASVFSPLLLSYYPPAQGIVLAYHDVKLSDEAPQPQPKPQKRKRKRSARARADDDDDEADGDGGGDGEAQHGDGEEAAAAAVDAEAPGRLLCKVVDEYAAPYLWATATFLVWRPRPASLIPARVTHQSSTHITLAHLNTFPVSVLKTQLPPAWTWHEEALFHDPPAELNWS